MKTTIIKGKTKTVVEHYLAADNRVAILQRGVHQQLNYVYSDIILLSCILPRTLHCNLKILKH